jgi:hypothetical protein
MVFSSPAVGRDGTVYVGSRDKVVYALDGVTGDKQWAYETGDYIYSSPTIATDGTVYVGTSDGKLYAFATTRQGGLCNSAWPKFHGDARNSGRFPTITAPLKILEARYSTNGFTLTTPGPAGPSWWLEASGDFRSWTPLTQRTNLTTNAVWVDPDSLNLPQRFYRLRSP